MENHYTTMCFSDQATLTTTTRIFNLIQTSFYLFFFFLKEGGKGGIKQSIKLDSEQKSITETDINLIQTSTAAYCAKYSED